MSPESTDVWLTAENSFVSISILVPNGLIVALKVHRESSLYDIKEDVFEEVQKQPLFGMLHDKQTYIFTCVNLATSEQEELADEDRRICDVRPFLCILRLVERKKDKTELELKSLIGSLIGKGLHEFDALKNAEVNDFRWRMRIWVEEAEGKRHEMCRRDKLRYLYPDRVVSQKAKLPSFLANKLTDGSVTIEIRLGKMCPRFSIGYDKYPEDAVDMAMQIMSKNSRQPEDFVLKVCGQEEYLMGSEQLINYKHIREMVASNKIPSFIAVLSSTLKVEQEPDYVTRDELRPRTSSSQGSQSGANPRKKVTPISVEDIKRRFSVKINSGHRINCPDDAKVAVEIGLYHGGEPLCSGKMTAEVSANEGEASWEESVPLDIDISDMPRMARLCVALFERKGSKMPLAWGNTTIFDYKNLLRTGCVCMSMWRYDHELDSETLVHPLGTVVSNPVVEEATSLLITFDKYSENDVPVIHPLWDDDSNTVLYSISENGKDDQVEQPVTRKSKSNTSKSYFDQYKQICERDPLTEMYEEDKKLLWFLKDDCYKVLPQSLPHVLNCVKWNSRKDVAEMMKLLASWPLIEPENALGLLDYAYADSQVRAYAVRCLNSMNDDDLLLYLLQLVQALKYESFLFNDLAYFLLRRALSNQHIGHHLFWLLRSEMLDPSVSVIFGLLLEAYCRGAKDHISNLMRQSDAMKQLQELSEQIRDESSKQKCSKEKQKALLADKLSQKCVRDILLKVTSPLDARFSFGRLKTEKCKLMDSKMKPFWLVFSNEDVGAEDIYVIFKDGDDLRQDMLTLQMIRFMDKLWKQEGYDFRMTPYRCASTSSKLGLIEVVLNASTIANIQKEKGSTATSAFKKGSLLAWLKDNNPDEDSLSKAIEEFTLSCAGYCVATYVLGIADRHSDNIMIKSNGQLFHIDFGHILGNFKEKFGIKRERCPFVLTHDFVHVITKGGKKEKQFERFSEYCEKAFLILRKKGYFIISLFAMMLSSGIPELSSTKDLDYLRDTLVLEKSESEALKHFKSKFHEALKNSWKTSLMWHLHNIAKDNK